MADTAGVESDFDLFDYLLNNPADPSAGQADARPPSPQRPPDEPARDEDAASQEGAEPELVSQEAGPPPLMALLDAPERDKAQRLAPERDLLDQPGAVDWSDPPASNPAATVADEAAPETEHGQKIPGWAAAPRLAPPGQHDDADGRWDPDLDAHLTGDPGNLVRLDRARWDLGTAADGETATGLDPSGPGTQPRVGEQAPVPPASASDVSQSAPYLAWPAPPADAVPLDLPPPPEARVIPLRPPAGLGPESVEPTEPSAPVSRFASGLDDDLLPLRRGRR